jgi:hypothetical protein
MGFYPLDLDGDDTDYCDPDINPSMGESLEFYSEELDDSVSRTRRLESFQRLIDRGGGVMAIGGHLILVVSPEPPPNKSHVVYVPLEVATAEILVDAVSKAQHLELKAVIPGRFEWIQKQRGA